MASSSNVSTTISSIYNNVQVPLFEGENYDFWAIKMETLFISLDVLELVKEGYEELVATTKATATQREELKKKKITDAFIDMNSSFCLKVKLGNGEYVEVEGKGSIGVATK